MPASDLARPELPDPNGHVPEATRHDFLDMLLAEWPHIARLARAGYDRHGRGAVTVRDGSVPPVFGYRAGPPCPCHADAVAAYDPEHQVVLAVIRRRGRRVVWVDVLSGWPSPHAAAALVGGREPHEVVH